MKKFLFLFLPLLLLTACGSSEVEVDPLTALPPHSLMVGVFDYSNENQRDLFDELRGRFPETGLWEKYVASKIDEDLKNRKLSYKKHVKPFLNGKWKAAMSLDIADIEGSEPTLYVAVSSTEPEKLQELFVAPGDIDGEDFKLEEEKGDYKYWTLEDDSFFLVRYKDLFVFTNEAGGFAAVKERIENGDSLADNQEFMGRVNSIAGENLGFFYVAGDELGSFMKDLYLGLGFDVTGDGIIAESLRAFGDTYTVIYADKEGFRIVDESEVIGGAETMEKLVPDYGGELNLAEKVNGEGVFLYGEFSGLNSALSSKIEMMSMQPWLAGEEGFAANETPDVSALLGALADAIKVFDGGVAIVMAEQGGFFPSIGLYFDIDEEDREAVLGMVESLDGYADKLIAQMDVLAQQEGVKISDFLKRDVELVKGGAVKKISVDLAALPKEFILGMTILSGGSLEKQFLELFYGLTGDNVFVLALASDLEEKYGKNVLADDENFKKAMAEVKPGYNMGYIRTQPLSNLVSRYVGLVLFGAGLREEDMDLAAVIQDWFSTIEYAVFSDYFEGGVIKGEMYLKITEPSPEGK